jgi:hypothetical protein
MEKEYIEILGIYPGMYASKFFVRHDSWTHYEQFYLNDGEGGNCFLPCKDAEGDALFVDIKKLLAYYVLTKPEEQEKILGKQPKSKKSAKKTNI